MTLVRPRRRPRIVLRRILTLQLLALLRRFIILTALRGSRRNVLVVVRIPPRLVLRGLHRLQDCIIDLTPQERALNVGRLRHAHEVLTRDQTTQRLLDCRVVVCPAVEMTKGGGPLFRVVFGHEREVVRNVANLLPKEKGDV